MYIKQVDGAHYIAIEIHEGKTYPKSDTPMPTLTIEVWPPHTSLGLSLPATINWPTTSDKRPELALALAKALVIGAHVAKNLPSRED